MEHPEKTEAALSAQVDPARNLSLEEGGSIEKETRKITGFKWFLFNVSTLTAIFLYALDNTIVANIQPAIVNDFNAVRDLPWISVAFMVGGLAMVMPLGKIYGLYDNKWVFFFFAVNFMAASALCGGAPNIEAEIVGRTWAGAGGNGLYYGLINLITANTLERERSAYLSLTGLVWGIGTVLGPVIGGALQLASWRWAFYINLFFGIFILPAYLFLIPSTQPAPHMTQKQKLASFDWTGAFLIAASLVLFMVATNFGGTQFPWNGGATISIYVLFGVLLIVFIVQQTFSIFTTPENRMFPMHLLRSKEVVLLFLLSACSATMAYVSVYYIPLYFQFTQGASAIQTAERILPFVFLLIIGMLGNGFLMSRLGYYKPWYVIGSAIGLVGGVLFSRVELETPNSAIYGYQVLIGLGAGCFVQGGFAVVQANIDPKDAVNGVTLMMFGQVSGLAFGLSMTGAMFINYAIHNLQAVFPGVDHATLESVVSGTSSAFLQTVTPEQRTAALRAIVNALQKAFIQVYAAAAASFILSWFLKWKKVYGTAAVGA